MYQFDSALWKHDGDAAWHFLTLPADVSDDIEARTAHASIAFGSVRVRVEIGDTSWATSVFPDTKAGAYVLPVKKAVRVAEGLTEGDVVEVRLDVV